MPVAILMVMACGLPLIASAFIPPWPLAFAAWFASGIFASYQVEINSAAVNQIPEQLRATWVGMLSAVLLGAQGLGLVVFGVIAQAIDPGWGIAIAGAAGFVIAVVTARRRAVGMRPGPRHRSARRPKPTGAANLQSDVSNTRRSIAQVETVSVAGRTGSSATFVGGLKLN